MEKAAIRKSIRLYQHKIKRVLDIIISILLIVLSLIPGILIAILIKLTSHGPIFFRQQRVGKDGQLFWIYKFRSMRVDAPHQKSTAEFIDANQYITKIGYIIRKTSIDEIPQLLNVFKGDMSIVGPRPLIPAERAINQQRHDLGIDSILPGITGLAQVNGRDRLNDSQKLRFDYQYYQQIGFCLDLRIIIKTITNVLTSKDIQDGQS